MLIFLSLSLLKHFDRPNEENERKKKEEEEEEKIESPG